MKLVRQIPNLITLLNLGFGLIAVWLVLIGEIGIASLFMLLALVCDYADGWVARILNAASDIGKELDSLADLVSFGVVPGFMMAALLQRSVSPTAETMIWPPQEFSLWAVGLLIPLSSALRLAKFNISTNQTYSFIGLPTPANAILIASLALTVYLSPANWLGVFLQQPEVLVVLTLLSAYLMQANISLFSFKFSSYGWAENKIRYIFILLCLILLGIFQYHAIPLLIFLYIALSLIFRPKHL
ncbi:MAG: CDP-diacylglycerol--serine O-phosphatidyltransferase [Bacteroidota bacterium]